MLHFHVSITNEKQLKVMHKILSGADPGFDRGGGGPDRDRPKTAILGPQFCRILVLGPHFWWSGGAPPGSAPAYVVFLYELKKILTSRQKMGC